MNDRNKGISYMRRVKDLLQNQRVYISLSILLAILCFIPAFKDYLQGKKYYTYYAKEMIKVSDAELTKGFIGELCNGISAEQSFVCSFDTIVEIQLYSATYMRKNHGSTYFELFCGEDGKELESWEIDNSTIKDHSVIKLICKEPMEYYGIKDQTCRLAIHSDSETGYGITLGYAKGKQNDKSLLYNNTEIDGDLIMTVIGYDGVENCNRIRIWMCIFLVIITEWLWHRIRKYLIKG